MYASLNLTGTIRVSLSVNSVLPKKSVPIIVVVAMYALTLYERELKPPISAASLLNSLVLLRPDESSLLSTLSRDAWSISEIILIKENTSFLISSG